MWHHGDTLSKGRQEFEPWGGNRISLSARLTRWRTRSISTSAIHTTGCSDGRPTWFRSAARTRAINSPMLNGLVTKSSAPRSSASIFSHSRSRRDNDDRHVLSNSQSLATRATLRNRRNPGSPSITRMRDLSRKLQEAYGFGREVHVAVHVACGAARELR